MPTLTPTAALPRSLGSDRVPWLLEMAEECFASQREQSRPAPVFPGQSWSCKGQRGGIWKEKREGVNEAD